MVWPRSGRYSPRKGKKRLPEAVRRRVLKRFPQCQLGIRNVCTGRSVERHHLRDCADYDDPNDPKIDLEEMLIGVCHQCHVYVSARRSAARANLGTRVLREKERHPGVLP